MRLTDWVYERALLVTPEPAGVSALIVAELQPPPGDVHHTGHPHLADPHLVHHLQLHPHLEHALHTLVDNLKRGVLKIVLQQLSSLVTL